jgi:hypothetical protein
LADEAQGEPLTTIAYRDGVLAADSLADGGSGKQVCQKLHRKQITEGRKTFDVVIGICGEVFAALTFVDWYGTGKPIPDTLLNIHSDFNCLILRPDGLYEVDNHCRTDKILDDMFAIGTGAHAARAAMLCGKSAVEAVRVAARIDKNTGGRIYFEALEAPTRGKKSKR